MALNYHSKEKTKHMYWGTFSIWPSEWLLGRSCSSAKVPRAASPHVKLNPLTSCPPSRAQSLVLCFLASTNTLNMVHTEAGMRKSVVLFAFCSLSSNAVLVLFIKTWIQSKKFWHMSHLFCKSEINTTRC